MSRSHGFPAHAGMDRSSGSSRSAWRRFPRPRGDGPCPTRTTGISSTVSPPTRGWTVSQLEAIKLLFGFPAHAGMDPIQAALNPPEGGFPRPRGDGPLVDGKWDEQELVSPPTRGWTSEPNTTLAEPNGLPSDVVSPPTRGWTVEARLFQLYQSGFPAHAGMDPCSTRFQHYADGFPRPRGDGPAFLNLLGNQTGVSPPTRGWT